MVIRVEAHLLVTPHPSQVQNRHLLYGVGVDANANNDIQYCLWHDVPFRLALSRRSLCLFLLNLRLFIHAGSCQVILSG